MWSWLTKQKECCHLSEHEQLDFAQLKKFFTPPPHAIILYFKTYDGLNFPRNIQLILKWINFVSFTIAFIEWDHRLISGLCLYLNKRYSRVNSKACQHFRSGCPNSSHQSFRNFQCKFLAYVQATCQYNCHLFYLSFFFFY